MNKPRTRKKIPYRLLVIMLLILMIALCIQLMSSTRRSNEVRNKTYTEKNATPKLKNGKKTEQKTESIPFARQTIEDQNTERGKSYIRTEGVNGQKTYTYEITYEDGREKNRVLKNDDITVAPVTEVTVVGTKIVWECVDVTSYDYNWNNDMRCESSDGRIQYTNYAGARSLESY